MLEAEGSPVTHWDDVDHPDEDLLTNQLWFGSLMDLIDAPPSEAAKPVPAEIRGG